MSEVRSVSILGVTGSIGQSTADVLLSAPEQFDVCTLTANKDAKGLAKTALKLKARSVVIADEAQESELRKLLKGSGISVLSGQDSLNHAIAPDTDITVAAISGMAGLKPLMSAIKNSKAVAIANKEPLVAAGHLVMAEAEKYGTKILPTDSEHNAIFQVFDFEQPETIKRIILTASGGPFLNWSEEEIAKATPEQAIAHPNWDMGAKISVDSASMVNKALEVIEAHILFGLPAKQIEVLIHPQSVVHSMVEYIDGSILAQMGASDMRTPIASALAWPQRVKTPGETLDLKTLSQLDFQDADHARFPALRIAYECLEKGQNACLTMNAANEIAVEAFLKKEIPFLAIFECIEFALKHIPDIKLESIDAVERADATVRQDVKDYIAQNYPSSNGLKKAV